MRSITLLHLVMSRWVAAPGLLAIRLCGVLVAVTLAVGVSLYSTAMGDAILQASLAADQLSTTQTIEVVGAPLAAAPYAALDRYVRAREAADLGLPLHGLHVHHYTSTLPLYRAGLHGAAPLGAPLAELALHYYAGLRNEIRVVAGTLDTPARQASAGLPIVVSRATARGLRLRVGDRLVYSTNGRAGLAPPMVVAAIVVPRSVDNAFWGSNTGLAGYQSLLAPRVATFVSVAAAGGRPAGPDYFWSSSTDPRAFHAADAPALLARIQRVRGTIATIAPAASLLTTMEMDVSVFLDRYNLLPFILLILVAPILALVLYAAAVATALVFDRQAGEVVLMRSRGAAGGQVFAIFVVEGLLLGLIALAVGPPLALPLARLIGNASGFLQFSGGLPIELRLTPQAYLIAAATAALSLLAALLPALRLSRRSMARFKQAQARLDHQPLWQRLYLDLACMAAALYCLFVLVRQGPITSGSGTAVIAQDPLIGVAPLLFTVAITLIMTRLLPRLAALGARLLANASSPPAHVALRSVARAPHQPMRLLQLCTLTLTLGIFAATVAGVEGSNLADQQIYDAGAPLRLVEYNAAINQPDALPLADHLALPGVRAATPALRFETVGNSVNATSDGTNVDVLGVDPATAAGVMWFRPDFAGDTFAALLHRIARPAAAIVSANFLSATGLREGDTFDVILANGATVNFQVAGAARYFPTLDPRRNPFVVANLSYVQHAAGAPGPSEVWLAANPDQATIAALIARARALPRLIFPHQGVVPAFSAQDQPLLAGLYGVVSVGFLIAVGLALLGFFAYAYLSLGRRLAEFAILRALGLSAGQLRRLLLFEQFFLLGAGILGGLVAGVLTTELFLPYMPIASNTLPPFRVVVPWLATGEFIAAVLVVFLLVLSVHSYVLLRLRLGRVLRLGGG